MSLSIHRTNPTAALSRRLVMIFNPVAGRRHHRRFESTVSALRAAGCAVELRATEGPDHAEHLARAMEPGAADLVVVAGGDGTINEAINGLTDRGSRKASLPLGIVPLGTANVLASEIGLGTGPTAVARTLTAAVTRSINLGRTNGRVFVMMAGVGFDAHVVANVDKALKQRIGKGAYVWQTLRQFIVFDYPGYRISVDDRVHRAASVIVAKGHFYAGRYVCAPKADLAAPSFEVCLFERPGPWNALRYALALGMGQLARLPDYRVLSARKVTIEGPEGDPVQGDGDIIASLPATIEVLSERLELVVPPPGDGI